MKQEVDFAYHKVCSACLSSDRDLVFIISPSNIYQIFRLLMCDVVGDKFEEPEETLQVCWECLALLRRFDKFKKQVLTAQQTILNFKENHENTDHTYSFSQSLSTLGPTIKNHYDFSYDSTNKIQTEWTPKIIAVSFGDNIKNEPNNYEQVLGSAQMFEDPNIIVKPQILIKQEPLKIEEHNGDETVLPKDTISESTKASTTEVRTIISRKKTNAQKCREYRERKKLQNTMVQNITAERSDECSGTDQLQAKKPKTNAERRRKHYQAQKLKKQESKKIPKSVKQKNKEYYERKKKIQTLNTLNHHSDARRKFLKAISVFTPKKSQ